MGGRRTWLRVVRRDLQALVLVGAFAAWPAGPAFAARPAGHGGGGGSGATTTGNDVSYAQCGGSLPPSPAFGIVGVNGGLANDANSCLGASPTYPRYTQSELYWAVASSVGGTSQPNASLYVNTADPGNVYNGTVIADWPTSGSTPYGSCTTTAVTSSSGTSTVGKDSDACAWQYGYDKAAQDTIWLTDAATTIDNQSPPVTVAGTAGSYPWWLDVETTNTWQSDTAMNVADLQGMIAGLQAAGASTVGVYSTSAQWDLITGGAASGALSGVPDWIPGAHNLLGAEADCALASFTGGPVTVTQWSSRPDGDYSC